MVLSRLLMGSALLALVSIPVQGCLFGEAHQDELEEPTMEVQTQVESLERWHPRGCALVRCGWGTVCIERGGRARCVPAPEPHPCAAILCIQGTYCRVVNGVAGCYPDGFPRTR